MSTYLARTFRTLTGSESKADRNPTTMTKDALKRIWKDLLALKDLENVVLWQLISIRVAYGYGQQSFLMDEASCSRAYDACQDAMTSFADFSRQGSSEDEASEPQPSFLMSTKVMIASNELASAMQVLHTGDKIAFLERLEAIRLLIASRLHYAKKTMHALQIIKGEEPKRVVEAIDGMAKVIDKLKVVDYAIREVMAQ